MPCSGLFYPTTSLGTGGLSRSLGRYWATPPATLNQYNAYLHLFDNQLYDSGATIYVSAFCWYVDFEGVLYPLQTFEHPTLGTITFAYAKLGVISTTGHLNTTEEPWLSQTTTCDFDESGWVMVNITSNAPLTDDNMADLVLPAGWLVDCDIDIPTKNVVLNRMLSESIGFDIKPTSSNVGARVLFPNGNSVNYSFGSERRVTFFNKIDTTVPTMPAVGLSHHLARNTYNNGNVSDRILADTLYNGYPVSHILYCVNYEDGYHTIDERAYSAAQSEWLYDYDYVQSAYSSTRYMYISFGILSTGLIKFPVRNATDDYSLFDNEVNPLYWLTKQYVDETTGLTVYSTYGSIQDQTVYSAECGVADSTGVVIDLAPSNDPRVDYFGKIKYISASTPTPINRSLDPGFTFASGLTATPALVANQQYPVCYGFLLNSEPVYWYVMGVNDSSLTVNRPRICWFRMSDNPNLTIKESGLVA